MEDHSRAEPIRVGLLTGGTDKPYALGLAQALTSRGINVDFIGSDQLDLPELRSLPHLRFLNLRGSLNPDASFGAKLRRVTFYYLRLLRYAMIAEPRIFHILWNPKVEWFDRTLLRLWYRLWGHQIVQTVHNVNIRKRDGGDTTLNRWTLRLQYRLSSHLFVHTEAMEAALQGEFGVPATKISVIPFGINDTVPESDMKPSQARCRLGLEAHHKVILFFGAVAPYKGLDLQLSSMPHLSAEDGTYRLLIAGRRAGKASKEYLSEVDSKLEDSQLASTVISRLEFIPENEMEIYFKAADVLVLPYRKIYQSGVLFLGYGFGLPVVATDVGSFREHVIENRTGFICAPEDPVDLASTLRLYFSSELYSKQEETRRRIREYASARYSWSLVGKRTEDVYRAILRSRTARARSRRAP